MADYDGNNPHLNPRNIKEDMYRQNPEFTSKLPFPAPPFYYKSYTEKAVKMGTVKCPPPVPSTFTVFGENYDLNGPLIPPIESKGIPRLYHGYTCMEELRVEMKKLNNSIMSSFLDLVQLLIDSPDSKDRAEKIDHLRVLFLNFHHLINELRPVQARHCINSVQQQQAIQYMSFFTKYQEAMARAQAAIISIPLAAKQMKDIDFPEEFTDVCRVDAPCQITTTSLMTKIIEDATGKEIDKGLLAAVRKSAKEAEDEEYMLRHWKEPPGEKSNDRKRMPSTSAESSIAEKRREIETDEGESWTSIISRREMSTEQPSSSSQYNNDNPLLYDRKSFQKYVKVRGVAPDLDNKALDMRKTRKKLMEDFIQQQRKSRVMTHEKEIADYDPDSTSRILSSNQGGERLDIYDPMQSDDDESSRNPQMEEISSLCTLAKMSSLLCNVLDKQKKKNKSLEIQSKITEEKMNIDEQTSDFHDKPMEKETNKAELRSNIPVLEEEAEEDEPRPLTAAPTGPSPVDEQPPILERIQRSTD